MKDTDKYGKIFNIRVPLDKQPIIDEYKEIVIDRQHSDLCYVTTSLIEAYVKAFREVPEPTIIRLFKQDITIQQNCTNIYGATLRKPRRLMPEELLAEEPLPQCEVCGKPATRRYIYPMHGYLDVCNEHYSIAKNSLGYKDVTKPETPIVIPPTFPVEPAIPKKKNFFGRLWIRVKQLLTKLFGL